MSRLDVRNVPKKKHESGGHSRSGTMGGGLSSWLPSSAAAVAGASCQSSRPNSQPDPTAGLSQSMYPISPTIAATSAPAELGANAKSSPTATMTSGAEERSSGLRRIMTYRKKSSVDNSSAATAAATTAAAAAGGGEVPSQLGGDHERKRFTNGGADPEPLQVATGAPGGVVGGGIDSPPATRGFPRRKSLVAEKPEEEHENIEQELMIGEIKV